MRPINPNMPKPGMVKPNTVRPNQSMPAMPPRGMPPEVGFPGGEGGKTMYSTPRGMPAMPPGVTPAPAQPVGGTTGAMMGALLNAGRTGGMGGSVGGNPTGLGPAGAKADFQPSGGMQAKFGPFSVAPGAPQAMGGMGMKKGGKVSSASSRADGCAVKGKTKGRFV